MLGLDGREELYEFFKRYDVRDQDYNVEELEAGKANIAALLEKQ